MTFPFEEEEKPRVKRERMTAPPPQPLIVDVKLEGKEIRFQRGDKVGQGSFGVVYKAIDKVTGRMIAIKQVNCAGLSEDQKLAIEKEVNLMESLNHTNVVRFLGCQRHTKFVLIFMEYVAGKSLHHVTKEFGRLAEPVVRLYITQILEGLVYCHSHKIIHRDIKAKNILLNEQAICKLADFGSAKLVDDILRDQGMSTNYHYTPLWLAPEVVTGKYTSKVDIWSLGCTMLELASGRDPWYEHTFENSFQALYFIAKSDMYPKFPSNLSPLAIDFLKACFIRDDRARPSAAELLKHDFIVKGAPAESIRPPLSPMSPTGTSSGGSFSTQKTDTSTTTGSVSTGAYSTISTSSVESVPA